MRALRARRAAAIEAADHPVLRDADELLTPAVEETISALQLGPGDQAAAQIARRYATVIDAAREPAYALRWLGPLLLDSLSALHATPAARAKPAKGPKVPERSGPSRLDQLRSVRRP